MKKAFSSNSLIRINADIKKISLPLIFMNIFTANEHEDHGISWIEVFSYSVINDANWNKP